MENPRKPDLHEFAKEARAQAERIREQAKNRTSEILARAEEQAQILESAANVFESGTWPDDSTLLQTHSQHVNLRGMENSHRVALSAAHSSPDDRLGAACRAADPPRSITVLAKQVGVSHTLLRNAAKGKGPIKTKVAVLVRDALGKDKNGEWLFDATIENWKLMSDTRRPRTRK